MYFSDVTPIDLMNVIRCTKTKEQGTDRISIMLIHKILDIAAPTIAHIFNCSLIASTFLSLWKQAFVHPKSQVSHSSKRLPAFKAKSKPFERMVHKQLTD